MKRAARAFWIARFDMESLMGAILRSGTWISLSLILAGQLVQWVEKSEAGFGPHLRAKSVPLLIWSGFEGRGSPVIWTPMLVHWGVAVLLLTPYARVAATLLYFAWVEPSRKRVLFTGLVLILLTVILLSDWV